MPKVVVIGLDCLTPQLLFDQWLDELPTFKRLVDAGTWGRLKSVDPPITVPAWSCMMSGYEPAQLGLYGFRHRVLGSYDEMYFAMSDRVKKKRVWEYLNDAGISSGTIGVPQTYPVKKVKGFQVSGFLAPHTDAIFTFPDPLREQLEDVVGEYMLDVPDFRSDDRDRILRDIHTMTERRFACFRHLIQNKPQDFMMIVEMGSDRIHHAFWRFIDPDHPKYEPGNKYEDCVFEYYQQLDREIAATLELLDDDTDVFVVSDHGARPMIGGFAVNDWLQEQGLLTLKEQPAQGVKLKPEMIDWEKTSVWAWGGYYARVFVNVKGREPNGVIPEGDLDAFLDDLTERFEGIVDDQGEPMGNIVMRPADLSPDGVAHGDNPDLMVYFGDLAWRSIGSLNHPTKYLEFNDTGPDDANHDHYGIYIHTTTNRLAAGEAGPGERDGLMLVDVGPTVLDRFGLSVDEEASGKPIKLE